MNDPDYHPDDDRQYECFDCGTSVMATSHPGSCPECGAGMRNRQYPIE